ncbi:unnamed protein product [Camellia sinensis]
MDEEEPFYKAESARESSETACMGVSPGSAGRRRRSQLGENQAFSSVKQPGENRDLADFWSRSEDDGVGAVGGVNVVGFGGPAEEWGPPVGRRACPAVCARFPVTSGGACADSYRPESYESGSHFFV